MVYTEITFYNELINNIVLNLSCLVSSFCFCGFNRERWDCEGGGSTGRVGGSSKSRMPMTGLEAIWASGTICTVGATGRGLIIGQPLLPEHSTSPLIRPEHSNQRTTRPSCSYSTSMHTIDAGA